MFNANQGYYIHVYTPDIQNLHMADSSTFGCICEPMFEDLGNLKLSPHH